MKKDDGRVSRYSNEPLIADMLKDPIVRLVMRRDQVTETHLIDLIESARTSRFQLGRVPTAEATKFASSTLE